MKCGGSSTALRSGLDDGGVVGLEEQHAVAVGVEAVLLANRVSVGSEDVLAASVREVSGGREGANQHKQG